MMTRALTITACLALSSLAGWADSKAFRSILGDAANIEKDAAAIQADLKTKSFDAGKAKREIDDLGRDIATLRKDVEAIDANLASLTDEQKKDWELVKTKVQLLTIFYDQKAELMNSDLAKNRTMVRALAAGIAKRAEMLQQTVNRLDR